MHPEDVQVLVGMAFVAFCLWKLCGFIRQQGTLVRRLVLIVAWGWLIINIAVIASDPPSVTNEEIKRQVYYAIAPLMVSIREMQMNRRKD